MALFKIKQNKIEQLKSNQVLEKNIQNLIENNLEIALDIYFLQSEYSTTDGGRIDTLGIDKNGSPVIIEYKKSSSDSVINQACSYLFWILDHKAEFEKLVKEKLTKIYDSPIMTYDGTIIENGFIDWSNPRIICIAENFNRNDLGTIPFLTTKIELLRYRIYENEILYLEPENYQKVKISNSDMSKKNTYEKEKQSELPKNYSVEDHINNASDDIKQIFSILREKITSLDEEVIEEPKAKYIAYKTSTNFVDVVILHNSLKVFLNIQSGSLNDPDNFARDLTKPKPIGHWGNGDYEIKIEKNSDLEKIFELIRQAYKLSI